MSNLTRGTVRDSLSVALTVGAYGTAFGAAGVAGGFSVLQTCLFSLLTFSGASQIRRRGRRRVGRRRGECDRDRRPARDPNALYGIQMAPLLDVKGVRRLAAAQIHDRRVDRGGPLPGAARQPRDARGFLVRPARGVFLFWNLFTLLGALGAKALGNPAS